MPSSNNHRSSSTSRAPTRIRTDRQIRTTRSSSVSSQQYVIILTNNSEIVRQPSTFRFRIPQPTQTAATVQNHSNHVSTVNNHSTNNHLHNYNDRELILNNLLRVELTDAIHQYMSRTRRSFPVYYIFDTSDESEQQQL